MPRPHLFRQIAFVAAGNNEYGHRYFLAPITNTNVPITRQNTFLNHESMKHWRERLQMSVSHSLIYETNLIYRN